MEFDGDTFWEVSTWNVKEIRNSCNMVLKVGCDGVNGNKLNQ
jgi:hypothetical protein